MLITEYIDSVKTKLATSALVDEFAIVEEWNQPFEGYLRVRITLANGDFLEVAEYFQLEEGRLITRRYRYQWMDDAREHLRKRWDNVLHYPHLDNAPHHVHLNDGSVAPGEVLSILDLLQALEEKIRL